MDDEELKEKFHDEVTMPSGKVTQRFAKLEKQIQQLSAKPVQ